GFGGLPSVLALGLHCGATPVERRLVDEEVDRAATDVDRDRVALLDETDRATLRRLRRNVPDREARCSAGEAAVGHERAGLSEATRLEIARRVEHLLHAGTAARAFVADDDDIAGGDPAAENALHGVVLTLEDARGAGELQDAFVDACGFHDATVE